MVEHLQSLNPAYSDYVAQLGQATHGAAQGGMTLLARGYQFATGQAALLSYLDAFKALALLFLLLIPLLFLVRPGTARAQGGAG